MNITENSTVAGAAQVSGNAIISGDAQVYGLAHVAGHAQVNGAAIVNEYAYVSGDATISGRAIVTGSAIVSGNVSLSGNAHVSGTAVVTEQHNVAWGQFKARSGRYTLTLYMQEDGSVGFTWGCRTGDDLRDYLGFRWDYAASGLDVAVLAFLREFEQANGIVVEYV